MSYLTLDDFNNLINDKPIEVKIKAWEGKSVWFKPITAKENIDIIMLNDELRKDQSPENLLKLQKLILKSTLCDEEGVLLFDDNNIDLLWNTNMKVVEQLYQEAIKQNFVAADKLEAAAENLAPAQP